MKINRRLALMTAIIVVACQPTSPRAVKIIDNRQPIILQTHERVPSVIFEQAGIALYANDRILVNGFPAAPDQPINNYPITLQIRRQANLTIITP